jgi:hypothetical protein
MSHFEGYFEGAKTFLPLKLSRAQRCCVLEGYGGLLVAVLCEQVFRGRGLAGTAPPPSSCMDACWWVGGCYSYIRFDPSLAVS